MKQEIKDLFPVLESNREMSDPSPKIEGRIPKTKPNPGFSSQSNKGADVFSFEEQVQPGTIKKKSNFSRISEQNIRKKKFSVSRKKNGTSKQTLNLQAGDISPKRLFFCTISKGVKEVLRHMRSKLKQIHFFRDYKNLSPFHYEIIGDNASSYDGMIENWGMGRQAKRSANFRLERLLEKIHGGYLREAIENSRAFIERNIPLFSPNSINILIWESFLLLLTLMQMFILSIEITFDADLQLLPVAYTLVLGLYLDIAISINTIIFKDGQQIRDRALIVKTVLKRKFAFEIIPCIILSIIYLTKKNQSNKFLGCVILLRFYRAKKLEKRFKELIENNDRAFSLYRLTKLVMNIFFCGHFIACLWHYVAFISNEAYPSESNWLKAKQIINVDWDKPYLYSMYWGLTTMLTVGYGDITPTNNMEMAFNIVAMFLGCGVFGYSMNSIGDILTQAQRRKNALSDQMKKVSLLLKKKNIPQETQFKVKKYLEFVWKQEQKDDPEHENFIMSKLSSKLRDEVFLHTNVKLLKTVPSLKAFEDKTLVKLARCMKKARYCPEEHVYKERDFENPAVFFVLEGNLRLVTERESTKKKLFTYLEKFSVRKILGAQAYLPFLLKRKIAILEFANCSPGRPESQG